MHFTHRMPREYMTHWIASLPGLPHDLPKMRCSTANWWIRKLPFKCFWFYKLDRANYITAPGLVWGAMVMMMTKVKLNIITDVEMLSMTERDTRGGLCYVSCKKTRQGRQQIPLPPPHTHTHFDIGQLPVFLMCSDANNRYSWAMSQFLPYQHLRWDTCATPNEILKTNDKSPKGYILDVDLEFP